ncbi:MAG: FtsW/RodA/SpoVE family cell cycle protein [Elusimicrobiales bacterium]
MMIGKKRNIDWVLVFCVYILIIISFVAVSSSVSMLDSKDRIIKAQLTAFILGTLSFIIMWLFDYDILEEYSIHIYLFGLLILIAVLFFGVVYKGSRSWFKFSFFSIQPSEFSRISLIIFISSYLSRYPYAVREFLGILKLSFFIIPFFILMIKQPDFSGILISFFPILVLFILGGMELCYFYYFLFYLLVAVSIPFFSVFVKMMPQYLSNDFIELLFSLTYFGVNMVVFIIVGAFFVFAVWYLLRKFNPLASLSYFLFIYIIFVSGYISGIFIKNQIKDYQYKRIESFLRPESDPRGAGYNIIQARIALGSGGFLGKGIFKGSQTRLGFIPERHTDFIVSVVGEEMGFVGVVGLILIYLTIINRIKRIALNSRNLFGYYLCSAFAGLFMGYFFVNIGMILGFFPVAGVPLPFVSYGGSNLVASLTIIGIIQSVYRRRISIA